MVVLAASIVTKGGKGSSLAKLWPESHVKFSAHWSMLMQSDCSRCIFSLTCLN